MKNLLPIGRFSQVTRLSVKMLRHYDELGLLKPALVDESSGYRYYSLAQAAEAERIRLLRSLELPLEAIREILSERDPQAVRERLEAHKNHLEAQVAQYQRVIRALGELEVGGMYPVKVRQEAAQPVLSKRLRTSLAQIDRVVPATLAELYGHLARLGVRSAEPPFLRYHDPEFRDEDMDLEIGLPSEALVAAGAPLMSGELPAGPVAYVLHVGPYAEIGRAYQALTLWMQEHGHESAGPPRESYLVGPGQVPDSAEYRTEILWPIRP